MFEGHLEELDRGLCSVRLPIQEGLSNPFILLSTLQPLLQDKSPNILTVAKVVYDCHVTAICSANNADYVKSIGADEIIDYTSQDVVQTLLSTRVAGHPMDLIIDCVGGTEVLSVYVCLHSQLPHFQAHACRNNSSIPEAHM